MTELISKLPLFVVIICIVLIVLVAFLILIERKALAAAQRRLGPSILGRHGLLQIIADVVKPVFKEKLLRKSTITSILGTIVLCYLLSQVACSSMFSGASASNIAAAGEFVIILQVICSGLACLFIIYLGYFSGSKYSFMGSVRGLISESSNDTTSLFIFLLIFCYCGGTSYSTLFLLLGILIFIFVIFIVVFIVLFYIFIMSQRSPADLIENEGELVAGYNLEYSAADLLVIYFSEYFHLYNGGYQYVFIYCSIAFCLYTTVYTTGGFNTFTLHNAASICPGLIFLLLFLVLWYRSLVYFEYARSWHQTIWGHLRLGAWAAVFTAITLCAAKIALFIFSIIKTIVYNIFVDACGLLEILVLFVGFFKLACKHTLQQRLLDPFVVVMLCELEDATRAKLFMCMWVACGTPAFSAVFYGVLFCTIRWLIEFSSCELPALETHPFAIWAARRYLEPKAWWFWGSEEPAPKPYNYWEGYDHIVYPSDIFIQLALILFIFSINFSLYMYVTWHDHGPEYKTWHFVFMFVSAIFIVIGLYLWVLAYAMDFPTCWAMGRIFDVLGATVIKLGRLYVLHPMLGNLVCLFAVYGVIAFCVDCVIKDFLTKELRIFLWLVFILTTIAYVLHIGATCIYVELLNDTIWTLFPMQGTVETITEATLLYGVRTTIIFTALYFIVSWGPVALHMDSIVDDYGKRRPVINEGWETGGFVVFYFWVFIFTRLYAKKRPWLPKFKKAYCDFFWRSWGGFVIWLLILILVLCGCVWVLLV